MGDTRQAHARLAAALVMVGSVLLTVVAAAPAEAADAWPRSCVEQTYGDRLTVPDYQAAWLVDLDIGLPNDNRFENYPLVLASGQFGRPTQFTWNLANGPLDSRIRYAIFDNEAPRVTWGEPPYPEQVRVRPAEPFPYDPPSSEPGTNPTWWVYAGDTFRTLPFAATLTWSDCDGDGDYQGDRADDNCVGLFNPDQRDGDGDGSGDACDPDDDNDGVADTSDNCPTVASSDQTDWDGDGVGNACDSTPGTAPVAPTPPTSTSPTPVSPPPGTSTGCASGCAYVRAVGLRHLARRHRLVGTVESVALGCRSEVPVTIWRKRSGADRKLVVVTTRSTGKYRTKAPRRAGRYYATVGSAAEPLCGNGTSRTVRVRRR